MRSTLADVGQFDPRSATAASSPDIIPVGATQVSDPESVFATEPSFAADLGMPVSAGQNNHIYLRAKNFGPVADAAKVYLYFAPAGLVLTPDLWKNNLIKTVSGADYVALTTAAPGTIAVSRESLAFMPPSELRHVSLIARVTSDRYPNPLNDNITTVDDYVQWVSEEGIALRTIVTASTEGPVSTIAFDFGNPDPDPRTFHITLSTSTLPAGTTVAFADASPGIEPPMQIPSTLVTGSNFSAGRSGTFPAHYRSQLAVSVWAGREGIPDGAELLISQYASSEPEDHFSRVQPEAMVLVGQATIRFEK